MSHIGEGELHAWLDGAAGDGSPEAADPVARHLEACADCRARLERARELRDRASTLLSAAAPADPSPPPFEEVRSAHRARSRTSGGRPRRLGPRTLAWVASLVVAVGAGWIARSILGGGPDGPLPDRVATGDPAVAEAPGGAASAGREEALASRAPDDLRKEGGDAPGVARALRAAPSPEAPWIGVAPAEARRWVGGAVARVPGLRVTATEVSIRAGLPAVRIRQSLPDGTPVEIVQIPEGSGAAGVGEAAARAARAPTPPMAPGASGAPEGAPEEAEDAAGAGGTTSLAASVGGFRIVVSAPVASDSLRVLVSRLREEAEG